MSIRSLFVCFAAAAMAMAADFPIGSKLQAVKVDDHGKEASFSPANATASVVMFTSTQCPVSQAYLERMQALFRDYKGKPVTWIFVNSNVNEPATEVDSYRQANKIDFAIYKDNDSALADKLNAQSTPEAYVFDKSGSLVYHGRIDDSKNPARIQQNSLRDALNAMLAGKPVPTAETRAFGCTIKRPRKTT